MNPSEQFILAAVETLHGDHNVLVMSGTVICKGSPPLLSGEILLWWSCSQLIDVIMGPSYKLLFCKGSQAKEFGSLILQNILFY